MKYANNGSFKGKSFPQLTNTPIDRAFDGYI